MPLGHEVAGLYPLPRLRMTSRAFAHRDLPEAIPQFFVSELRVAELPDEAQAAATRVFGTSADPLGAAEWGLLDALAANNACSIDLARAGLRGLARAFRLPDGGTVERTVPGSFYEFISRDIDPAIDSLDLTFDSGNATGVFAMTRQ